MRPEKVSRNTMNLGRLILLPLALLAANAFAQVPFIDQPLVPSEVAPKMETEIADWWCRALEYNWLFTQEATDGS